MKKIAIVTLNGYFNYGNRLQNYALQKSLESLGMKVETLVYFENAVQKSKPKSINRLINYIGKSPIELIYKISYRKWLVINKEKIMESQSKRSSVFKDFTRNYIKETDYVIKDDEMLNNISQNYDYFVVGSDQVWNPHFINNLSFYFLSFIPKNKRIAYAPSFGVSTLEENIEEEYRKRLNEIEHISVREEEGASLIKKLINREVPVLIDPTMLLTQNQWMSVSKKANNRPNEGYLLTYFLGSINFHDKKKIYEIARKNNLAIIQLGSIKEFDTYQTGPSEFIDYIKECSIFFTDSFHGCVFSIIFEKPFVVFNRGNMNSRIDTLLSKFNLETRKWESVKKQKTFFDIDYSHAGEILDEERKESFKFLKEALQISMEE